MITRYLAITLVALVNSTVADENKDVSVGEQLYVQCTGCHSPSYHRTGPKHCNIVGKQAATAKGFDYTEALKNSGIIWNFDSLDLFLKNPIKMVPGTSMGFIGMNQKQQRHELIRFLQTLDNNNPRCQ